ncbi:MAG: glycosyltransferase, partial [Sedimenticolaceae bacterium]
LVCVHHAACDRIEAENPKLTQLCSIPSGVPMPSMAADQRLDGGLKLVYVGRLVQEQKRILDLLDAMKRVLEALPDATLTLIGHGQSRADEIAVDCRIDELGLSRRIQHVGTVEPDRLHALLIKFHVLVLLSDYEGTPGSVMDGMACGLVPVCLDIPGGVRELVVHEETGLLVKDRGTSFVAAIKQLAEDVELRQRLSNSAREHVRQGYSLSVAADRWEIFLESLTIATSRRSRIKKPRSYGLPPVSTGLAREDSRRPNFFTRTGYRVYKRLGGWWRTRARASDLSASFLRPSLNVFSMDRYLVRRSILDALTSYRECFEGVLLDVGCGQMPYKPVFLTADSKVKRYIGLDFAVNPIHENQPDLVWEDGRIPLEDASIDSALCTEVLEHCPDPDAVLAEIARVLRPGGYLLFTVPFLWPLHEVPYDHYRYTPFALRRHLTRAGLGNIELHAMGGWDASLAQILGLWVRRRNMPRIVRVLLSTMLYPFVRALIALDKRSDSKFRESQMITGIWGAAVKMQGGDTTEPGSVSRKSRHSFNAK